MALELVGHAYGSSDDDDHDHASEEHLVESPPTTVLTRHVELAPTVIGVANATTRGLQAGTDNSIMMKWNAPASTARAPLTGPVHPYRRSRADGASHSGGRAEPAAIEDWSFHEQYHNFHSYGYAEDAAGGSNLVGSAEDLARAQEEGAATVSLRAPKRPRTWKRQEEIGDESVHGIWAPEPEEDEAAGVNEALSEEHRAEIADAVQSEHAKNRRGYDVNEDHDRRDERKLGHILPPRHDRDTVAIEASSEFHGERELDYQGRSWLAPAPGLSRRSGGDHDCFIPKKCIHRFTGHSKGIQTVRLFPSTGHLALSGSMDATCKIWDVYNDRRLLRTYSGHAEAVRDVAFSNDGKAFASTGFDRFVRIWDTETGHCLHTLTPNRKMSYCVDFYPRDASIILAGASDNRIYQWDLRAPPKDDDRASSSTAQIVQEYNYHLQPVNSVTFIDDDQRFVSTGDDKKIFVWEFNIPVRRECPLDIAGDTSPCRCP